MGKVVLFLLMIGLALAAATSGNTGGVLKIGATASDQQAAADVLGQASNLKSGFAMMVNNGVSAASVTLDTTAATGLFGPDGTMEPLDELPRAVQGINPASVAALPGGDTWELVTLLLPARWGDAGVGDIVAVKRVTEGICTEIVRKATGGTTIPDLAADSLPSAGGDLTGIELNTSAGCVSWSGAGTTYWAVVVLDAN